MNLDQMKEVFQAAQTIFPLRAMIAAVVFVGGMVWYSLRGRKQ